MRQLFFPTIDKVSFPNVVRGPGALTPIDIRLSGWGFVKVSHPHIAKSQPFKQFRYFKSDTVRLDVAKEQLVKITFWNIFGRRSFQITTPENNTDVENIVEPKFNEANIPTAVIFTPEINTRSFSTSILGGLRIYPILSLAGRLKPSFSILNRSLNSYKLKRSIQVESIKFAKPIHQTNYKLTINFNSIQINNDPASNITKGSKK